METGTKILSASGEVFTVDETLAAKFREGDRIIANTGAGLLHIEARDAALARDAVTRCASAFDDMEAVADDEIVTFFHELADRISDDEVWQQIERVNEADVASARARGRTTTRLAVSEPMRQNMIDGLRGWAAMPSRRNMTLDQVDRDGFRVELVGAALGVVAFVFEGRPNVLADACGVLRGGNTAVFRIGSDALATAGAMMSLAVVPSLRSAGLPEHAVTLIDSASHASGWALFLDERLSLAVARGSGPAVELLGSLAQSVGTPVSLHGTGGAWMVAGTNADASVFADSVTRSLDRKVCNTLNTCCIVRDAAEGLVPRFLAAIREAGDARDMPFKLHVARHGIDAVPAALFTTGVQIARAEGTREEMQAEVIDDDDLGLEWEWESCPEVTLVIVDSVDHAVDLFNHHSPRLVASLISEDSSEQARFWDRVRSPFVGDGYTRWVDGQFALDKPELGLSNWANGRLFGRGGILTGDSVYSVRTRYIST